MEVKWSSSKSIQCMMFDLCSSKTPDRTDRVDCSKEGQLLDVFSGDAKASTVFLQIVFGIEHSATGGP